MERLDHVLVRVSNLDKAVNQFRMAGFTVYYGAKPEQAYNAMIYFEDHSFIELVDTTKFPVLLRCLAKTKILNLGGSFYKRIGAYALSKERFLDYSIYSGAIEEDYKRIKTRGIKLHELKRTDVFGKKLQWKLFATNNNELPFVMSAYAPSKYPEVGANQHKNSIQGIQQLEIQTTHDLTALSQEIVAVFGTLAQNISLEQTYLEIKTQNATIRYIKGEVNKIRGIWLNSLAKSELNLSADYGIFCN